MGKEGESSRRKKDKAQLREMADCYRTVVRNLIFTLSEPLSTSDLQDQCFLMLSFIIGYVDLEDLNGLFKVTFGN